MESASTLNPLQDLLTRDGAEFQTYDKVEIVSTFGDPPAEYAAIRAAAGLMDLPQRGVLELAGKDRLAFLNNLLTNQTWDKNQKTDMPANSGVYAFFLNLKGRIVADLNVLDRGEKTLIEMDVRLVEPVRKAFEKYLFAEKVTFTSQVGALHEIALHGPASASILNAVGAAVDELAPLGSITGKLFGFDVTVWRDDPCGVPGYHVLMETSVARAIWANLLVQFGAKTIESAKRLQPIGWAAFNTARIEAGRPLFGIDFEGMPVPTAYPAKKQRESEEVEVSQPGTLPAETGMFSRAVSITKGCYLGQEIVARMHARSQVARQIVGLRIEGDFLPLSGAVLTDEKSNAVGVVTSSTPSPAAAGAMICLATVKKPHMGVGTELSVPAEGAMRKAKVVALPFSK